jgi:hypothetical protein
MTNKKISQLTGATTPLTGTEELAIVQGGQTVKATAQDVADLGGGGLPYLVYTALLTQTGTDAPVATVLENTIDVTLQWVYLAPGQYRLALPSFPSSGPFIVGKTFVFIGSAVSGVLQLYANNNTSMGIPQNNGIIVRNYDSSFSLVDDFTNTSIEIRIYP